MTVSTDFQHGYSPPGVYLSEDNSTVVGTVGLPATLVALVGPAVGYRTGVEQFSLAAAAYRLTQRGVDQASVVVTRVDTGATLTTADYDLTPTSSPSAGSAYYTDVTRDSGSGTPSGTAVFASYRYTDPDYFSPIQIDDYESVKERFGEPLNLTAPTTGQADYVAVLSPLSLAAKVAFENGAGSLVLVATTPPPSSATTSSAVSAARRAALSAGYVKLLANSAVNVVVPVTDGVITADASGAGTELTAHITSASSDGYYRFGVVGFDAAVTTDPATLAGALHLKRVALAYAAPGGLTYYNGGAGQSIGLGHQYLAAAYAGRLAALPVQNGLTQQQIRSFTGISGTGLTNTQKNSAAAAGVAITHTDRQNRLVVRHGLTTDSTSVTTREISVVRARDALVVLVQNGMDSAGLIGQPLTDDTPLGVKTVISGLLEYAKNAGTIIDYTSLQVRVTSSDPTVIEVRFAYRPAFPINYITINFTVDTTTGDTSVTDTVA